MNKRVLKRYLNGSKRVILKNCFEYEDGYIISDSYSVIRLNKTYDLKVSEDKLGICKFYDNFNQFEFDFELRELEIIEHRNKKFAVAKLNDNYSINVPIFNKIKAIINANKFTIVKSNQYEFKETPVIKLENTKTNEIGYMLPMRKF